MTDDDMAQIPGGTFRMGSDTHYPDERPAPQRDGRFNHSIDNLGLFFHFVYAMTEATAISVRNFKQRLGA